MKFRFHAGVTVPCRKSSGILQVRHGSGTLFSVGVNSPSDNPNEYDVQGVTLYSMMEQDWSGLYPMDGAQM